MADVLLSRAVAAFVVLRGIGDVAQSKPGAWLLLGAGVVALLLPRRGLVAPCGVALGLQLGGPGPGSGTLVLIAWMSLACLLFSGSELTQAVRAIAVTVYVFAGLNKLSENFLSGAILDEKGVEWLPATWVLAPLAVVAELGLAVAVWRRWRYTWLAATVVHVGIVVGMATTPARAVSLGAFNALVVLLAWRATTSRSVTDGGGEGRRLRVEPAAGTREAAV